MTTRKDTLTLLVIVATVGVWSLVALRLVHLVAQLR
jgi:hypothetical protein